MACCGDVPTLETLAAVSLLREHLPELKVRVVNVVDLMRLQPETEHPHGMSDAEFDALFTTDKPVIFAYHGYPWLIHRLTYRRHGHDNLHVRGYKEEGTTTTPFDMVMLNDLDRFHLVMDVIDRVPGLAGSSGHVRQLMMDKRITCRAYTREQGEDAPEITNWKWTSRAEDRLADRRHARSRRRRVGSARSRSGPAPGRWTRPCRTRPPRCNGRRRARTRRNPSRGRLGS